MGVNKILVENWTLLGHYWTLILLIGIDVNNFVNDLFLDIACFFSNSQRDISFKHTLPRCFAQKSVKIICRFLYTAIEITNIC